MQRIYWLAPIAGAAVMSGVMIAQEAVKNNARTELKQVVHAADLARDPVLVGRGASHALRRSRRRCPHRPDLSRSRTSTT